jgi:hypothetical protein
METLFSEVGGSACSDSCRVWLLHNTPATYFNQVPPPQSNLQLEVPLAPSETKVLIHALGGFFSSQVSQLMLKSPILLGPIQVRSLSTKHSNHQSVLHCVFFLIPRNSMRSFEMKREYAGAYLKVFPSYPNKKKNKTCIGKESETTKSFMLIITIILYT